MSHQQRRSLLQCASSIDLHQFIPEALAHDNVNIRDEIQMTPILWALSQGCSLETLNILIDAGANIRTRDNKNCNALHSAFTGYCSDDVINRLLEFGEDMLFEEATPPATPIDFALIKNRLPLLMPVVVKHKQINDRYLSGCTLLHVALQCKHPTSVKFLLQFMSQTDLLDYRDENGCTYLHHAIQFKNKLETIRYLLEAGMDPATKNNLGDNALHMLCMMMDDGTESHMEEFLRGHPDIIEELNNDGVSPLSYASSTSLLQTILKWTLLQNNGQLGPLIQSNYPIAHLFHAPEEIRTALSGNIYGLIHDYASKCQHELTLLRNFKVTDSLSLFHIVKACYVSPNFINKLRVKEQFLKVLEFDGQLLIYEEEVKVIVRMVRTCSSVYGKTLPFPKYHEGFVLASKKVLDYLDVDDLERLAEAERLAED